MILDPVEATETCLEIYTSTSSQTFGSSDRSPFVCTFEGPDLAAPTDRGRAALLELLPSGSASLAAVSRKLAVSTRILQRRLRDEEHSFQVVLDSTREELARQYLGNSTMSGAEISFLLGFEDPNSFFRAYRAWTGSTPESARAGGVS